MNILERYLIYQRAKKAYEAAIENYSIKYITARHLHKCFEYYFNRACKVSVFPFKDKLPELYAQSDNPQTIDGLLFLVPKETLLTEALEIRVKMLESAINSLKEKISVENISEIFPKEWQDPAEAKDCLQIYFIGDVKPIEISYEELEGEVKKYAYNKYWSAKTHYSYWCEQESSNSSDIDCGDTNFWVVHILNSRIENYEKKLKKPIS